MIHYLIIILMTSGGVWGTRTIEVIEFSSKLACEAAQTELKINKIESKCLPKGNPWHDK